MKRLLLCLMFAFYANIHGVPAQQYNVGIPAPLNNFNATTAPTSANDNTQGYTVGSLWQNTTTGTVYMARSVATGNAVWTAL